MLNTKTVDVTKNFINHGIKLLGDYYYILLIDLLGQTLIRRMKTDNTDIKFALKSSGTIEDFWADPTVHEYKFIHQL